MSQFVFSGTTGDVGNLNANFTELYAVRNLLTVSGSFLGLGVTPAAKWHVKDLLAAAEVARFETTNATGGYISGYTAGGVLRGFMGWGTNVFASDAYGLRSASGVPIGLAMGSATFDLLVDTSHNVLVQGGGVSGYGPGSGGTVTQATSKSTGVTLNKACGQITMNGAALAAGASVSFTVTDSLVTAADVVLCAASGNSNYRVECASVAAGSFTVRVTNVTGGSLSDALLVNFIVHRGVTS